MMTTTLTAKTDAGNRIIAQIDAAYGADVTAEMRAAVVPFIHALHNVTGATRDERDAAREQIICDAFESMGITYGDAGFDWVDAMLQNRPFLV